MARNRSVLRDNVEYFAFCAALNLTAILPIPLAFPMGRLYGRLLDLCVPRLRRVGHDNLSRALPGLNFAKREVVIDGVFASIGRLLVTFARFPQIHRRNIGKWIRGEGMEHVNQALARGQGLLFATGHLGNWELSAFAFALLEKPISIVVRPLDNARLDTFIQRYRGFSGNRAIGKNEYARGILKALARNELVGILADQNDTDGIFVEVFGQPAATSPGIAKFAAKTGAAVVPGFALWSKEERKYVLRFYPEVPISGDVLADTQRIQSAIESVIRAHPDQWMWIHRRWKTQPPASR